MKLKELMRRLDKGSPYFWARTNGIGYRLVNALTLKTAMGTENRLDALRITRALQNAGYQVAKMEERMGAE